MRRSKEPIKLAKFTVLVGPNNSAKTTLLLALFMLTYSGLHPIPFVGVDKGLFLETYLGRNLRSLIYLYSGVGRARCTLMNGRDLYLKVSNKGVEVFLDGEQLKVTTGAKVMLNVEEGFSTVDEAAEALNSAVAFIPHSRKFEEDLMNALVNRWEDV